MTTNQLIQLIKESPEFARLSENLRDGSGSIQIEGLTAAAKSLVAAALHTELDRPVLLVTYNFEQAEQLYEDLALLGMKSEDILLVPPADSMIYQEADSDLDIIGRRIQAFMHLHQGKNCVVIAPIAAVLQRTTPPDILESYHLRIEKSQQLDMEAFCSRLVEMGYEHAIMVERPGEFSKRGGILDVFPSNADYPIRIELWGDDIDSIHNFDVESQRSAGEKRFVDIAPAREMLLDKEKSTSAAERLIELLEADIATLEDSNAAVKLRDRIENDIERIRNQAYFDGIEYYFPAVYPDRISLLDYLPAHALVILDEPHQIKSHWEQLHEELLEALQSRILRGEVLELPEDHVVAFEDAADFLKRRGRNLMFSLLQRQVSWLEADEEISMPAAPMDAFGVQINMLVEQLKTWLANKCRVMLVTNHSHRIVELLNEHELSVSPSSDLSSRNGAGIYVVSGALRSGFKFPAARMMVVTDHEMFGFNSIRRPRKTFKKGMAISSLLELNEGDLIVHINHGIGRYLGLTKLAGSGGDRDYLLVEYAGVDRLYVPVDQIDRIQKYIGSDGHPPALNKLGGNEWAKTTKKVKASVQEMAKDLLALYAARQSAEGYSFSPDTPWQQEMEAAFPYEETPDQLDAIMEVKQDLESPKPMDRLVCGDVGYGKTEVAIRAVFKAINDGKQVALLAPTTVLSQQHFNTFTERLAAYPVTIGLLSRFKSRAEQKKTIEGLKTGEVDLVIGTHRLLSKDVEFRDLGLLVVDEEQRFGVAHKERLKQLRKTIDVLTLSATPIPRTLHMSLSGIRDMSLINDPPEGRTPIKTYCREFDDEMVRDAVLRELDRDGQIYFVHNRVENIEHIAEHIRTLAPYARVDVGHGQMAEDELERVMLDFYEHKFDVLVCTTIIESGLDIPNVNTIIVNNADKMGLAQLYQLRGRVGRSNRQAYAYLLYEPHRIMSDVAEKRLQAIREFSDLGSGFKIALRDLEIRGAGNLLGSEQHGQMASVGFDMYCQMLSEAIQEMKGEEIEHIELPPADLPMDAYIPMDYIPTEGLRISFYKKMTAVRDPEDVEKIEEEIRDRFGIPPAPVTNSLEILKLRIKAGRASAAAITTDRRQVAIKFGTGIKLAADISIKLKRKFPGIVFQPDKVIFDAMNRDLIARLHAVLDALPKALEESKAVYFAKLF